MDDLDSELGAAVRTLVFALEKYPERVEILPVASLLLESARQNAKRPAYVKLAVPDDMVQGLRGSRDEDVLLLVKIPRETAQRSESRIILPGEVG